MSNATTASSNPCPATEHTTAVSLLDRLLHRCPTVVTDNESYRMRQARQRGVSKINKA